MVNQGDSLKYPAMLMKVQGGPKLTSDWDLWRQKQKSFGKYGGFFANEENVMPNYVTDRLFQGYEVSDIW